jgi:hypothetical protein
MPKRAGTRGIDDSNTSDTETRCGKKLPRKGRKVSLPFRAARGAKQHVAVLKHASLPSLRQALTASETSPAQADHVKTGKDKGSDGNEQRAQSRLSNQGQRSRALVNYAATNGVLLDNGPRARPTVRGAQSITHLEPHENSPYVILGPGGGDPFSTLPSDLPRAFLDEHLHTSEPTDSEHSCF